MKKLKSLVITGNLCQDVEVIVPYYVLSMHGQCDLYVNTWPIKGIEGLHMQKYIPHEQVFLPGMKLARKYDILVLAGGCKALEKTRQDPWLVQAVIDADKHGVVIASICHGIQMAIEADILKGKRALGYDSIRKDIENAGGIWASDEDNDPGYVIDGKLVSCRHYDNMPQWLKAAIDMVKIGKANEIVERCKNY